MRIAQIAAMAAGAALAGTAVADHQFTIIAQTPGDGPCTFLELHEGTINDDGDVAFVATSPGTGEGIFTQQVGGQCFPIATSLNGFMDVSAPSMSEDDKISFVGASVNTELGVFLFNGVNPFPELLLDAAAEGFDAVGWTTIGTDDLVYYTRACYGDGECGPLAFCLGAIGAPDLECDAECLPIASQWAGERLTYLRVCPTVQQVVIAIGFKSHVLLAVELGMGALSVPSINAGGHVAAFVDADLDDMPAGIYVVPLGGEPSLAVDLTGDVTPVWSTRPLLADDGSVAFEATGPAGDGVYMSSSAASRVLGAGDELEGLAVAIDSVALLDGNAQGQLLLSAVLANGMTALVRADPVAPSCPADVNGDTIIDVEDLVNVLKAWGFCGDCPEDITGDASVGSQDLLQLFLNWGACPVH